MQRYANGLIAATVFLLFIGWSELWGAEEGSRSATTIFTKHNSNSATTTSSSSTTTSNKPYDGRPRLFFAEGCSGSSATLTMTTKIITEHYGFQRHSLTNGEAYDSKRNKMFKKAKELLGPGASDEDALEESFRMLHQDAVNKKEIMIMKLDPRWQALKNFFKDELNATFSAMIRSNAVDTSICIIRDCFGRTASRKSHAVFANGTKSDLCFQRRKLPNVKVMAYMDPREFPNEVKARYKTSQTIARDYELEFSPFKSQSYEQLFAFEQTMDEAVYNTSLEAWINFMDPLLDGDMDVATIERLLRAEQGTRSPPSPHSTVIYNYEEASTALWKKKPALAEEFLRE